MDKTSFNDGYIHAVLEQSCDGMIIIDERGIVKQYNAAAEKILGYTSVEIIGKNVSTLMPNPDRKNHDGYLKNYHDSKKPKIIGIGRKVQALHKNGHLIPIELSISKINYNDTVFYSGIIRDITKEENLQNTFDETVDLQSLMLKNVPDFVFIKDKDFRIVMANDAFLSVYPLNMQNKIIGYTTVEEYTQEDAKEFLKNDAIAFENGISEVEESVIFPDGIKRTLLTKKIRFNAKNHQPYILCIARDITALKMAEKKRLEIENSQKVFADACKDGFWDWYIQDDYEYMSERFWEILGYKPHEKKHHPSEWQALAFPEDLQKTFDNFDKHLETKGRHPFIQEVRYKHKNGTTVWIICKGQIVEWDESGKPLRMIGTHTDITEQKKIQIQLAKSNALFSLASKTAKIGHWHLDLVNNGIFWSDQVYIIHGVNKKNYKPELVSAINFYHPNDRKKVEKSINNTIKNCVPFEFNARILNGNTIVYVLGKGVPEINDSGKCTGIFGILLDITEQKIYEIKLHNLNKELEDFVHIASHDLKEPLRGISNYAQFLEEDLSSKLDEDTSFYLKRIKALSERLEKLTDDLLHYAMLGHKKISVKNVNFEKVIEDIRSRFFHIDGIEILSKNCNQVIKYEKVLLEEMIFNLVSNAVKYNDKQYKKICISLKNTENNFYIFVHDNGIGIPKEHLKTIFQIFQRLPQAKAFENGSGSGLSFVKKIVDRFSGQIKVRSKQTLGSTFMVKFPKKNGVDLL